MFDRIGFMRRQNSLRTWGQLKSMIERAGVKDDDKIFGLDIGPYAKKIVVDRDEEGVEIEDDSSAVIERKAG